MATHQSPAQRKTVDRVMHEYKHGELKTARGARKVKNPKQAVAIALHEAGASKFESPKKNARNLRRTKEKERRGETGEDAAEGTGRRAASTKRASGSKSSSTAKRTPRAAARSSSTTRSASPKRGSGATRAAAAKRTSSTAKASGPRRASTTKRSASTGTKRATGKTRAELYTEATRRKIAGRSRMSKAQLERALRG